jgi:UDP-2,3-diacylglucosamine hydrolase
VLHGNRDFLLGERFAARTGCVVLPDPVIADLDGVRCVLTHGDLLCTEDLPYQELRSTVRDAAWRARFLALPAAQRLQLADAARSGSRAHTQRTRPQIMDVSAAAVDALFRATRAQLMIHGHTHRPAIHELAVDGSERRRVVLDAWYEHGNLLWLHEGEPALENLRR